ncbi:MAG: sulfotransferase family protein [Candidatus Dojkabacteria bacterium]
MPRKKNLVYVVGMHRSGTSMLANMLHELGVYFGEREDLYEANAGNVFGHFENKGAIKLDYKIFRMYGGTWIKPPKLRKDWHKMKKIEYQRNDAQTFLMDLSRKHDLVGLKIPNLSYTYPFWKYAADLLKLESKPILIYRNPLEVAGSLSKRNNMGTRLALKYWEMYNASALETLQGSGYLLLRYEDIVNDPQPALAKIINYLNLKLSDKELLRAKLAVFPEVRHNTIDDKELFGSDEVAEEVKAMLQKINTMNKKVKMVGSNRLEKLKKNEVLLGEVQLEVLKERISSMDELILVQRRDYEAKYKAQHRVLKDRYKSMKEMGTTIKRLNKRNSELKQEIARNESIINKYIRRAAKKLYKQIKK